MPQSYGTLSHLCASVAHESASSAPRTRWRRAGLAAAQRPNAPSTCTHAPAVRASRQTSSSGSIAPPLTLPAWATTIAGSPGDAASACASASARSAPPASTATGSTQPVPRPSRRSARSTVTWRSAPASTPHPRRPDQPVALDVVPHGGQHAMARRGEAGDVGHLATGDECERRALRQPEQRRQPASRDLLDGGRRGRRVGQARVLIPGGSEPVGGDRGRVGAAHHEAEEARRVDRGEPRLRLGGELGDHVAGCQRSGAKVAGELELAGTQLRADRAVGQRPEPICRALGHVLKQRACIGSGGGERGHRPTLPEAPAPGNKGGTPKLRAACARRPW